MNVIRLGRMRASSTAFIYSGIALLGIFLWRVLTPSPPSTLDVFGPVASLGPYDRHAVIDVPFTLHNSTANQIVVESIFVNCGCVAVDKESFRLESGESTKIIVTLKGVASPGEHTYSVVCQGKGINDPLAVMSFSVLIR